MKQLLVGLLCGAGIALGGVFLIHLLNSRGRPGQRRLIHVTGTATTHVAPDHARIEFAAFAAQESIEKTRQQQKEQSGQLEADLDQVRKKHDQVRMGLFKSTRAGIPWSPAARVLKPGSEDKKLADSGDAVVRMVALEQAGGPENRPAAPDKLVFPFITLYTIELEARDAQALEQAAWSVVEVAVRKEAVFDTEARPGEQMRPVAPRVTFYRRNSAVERQRVLEDAVAAARADAQKIAGPQVPVEILEVSEQTPQPVVLTITNDLRLPPLYGQSGPPSGMFTTQVGPGSGGMFSSGERKMAIDVELTCKVVIKCAY